MGVARLSGAARARVKGNAPESGPRQLVKACLRDAAVANASRKGNNRERARQATAPEGE